MKHTIVLASIAIMALFSSNIAYSQSKKSADKSSTVVATVGKEKITYNQLEKAFQKNMNRKGVQLNQVPKDSVMDFLNLYVNYRLKVNDALSRGFHQDSSVIEDISVNRRVLAESFFYEKKLTEPWVAKWLEMREKEYKVAVIITAFGYEGDTTAAYEKIMKAQNELNSGKSFAQVATTYSEDPETAKQGGEVNSYITVGKVNRTLENAIYQLEKNEYTKQHIRTKFGYFLIKAIDLQPRKYMRLRTMFLDFQNEELELAHYKSLTDSLVREIRSGKASFGKIAKEFSKDTKTSKDEGYLGGYYTRSTGVSNSGETFLPELENEIYKLKVGEISDPIQVKNGLHIFQLDSIVPIDKIAEKDELRALYKRLYFNEDKKLLIDSLALLNNFSIEQNVLNSLAMSLDSTKTTMDSAWAENIPNDLMGKKLYSLNNQSTTVKQFVQTLGTKPEFRGNSLSKGGLESGIDKIVEPIVFDLTTANLEEQYSDFNDLVREFRDGILLFKVEAIEVWDKMKFDSTIAKKFYDTTSLELIRPDMYDISEIYLLNDSTAQGVYQSIKDGQDFDQVAKEQTQRFGMRNKSGNLGWLAAERKNLAETAKSLNMKVGEISKPVAFEGGWSIIKLNAFEKSRKKTFPEAISEIAPKVQDIIQKQLTNNWLDKVRKDFTVKIDKKALQSALK